MTSHRQPASSSVEAPRSKADVARAPDRERGRGYATAGNPRATPLFLLLVACGSTSSAPRPPPPSTPHCITDLHADALTHAQAEVAAGDITEDSLEDADGDSQLERIVAYDCGATGACSRAIYFSSHGCAHYAGTVRATTLALRPGYHHGVRDLLSFESQGCAGLAGTLTKWDYDGQTFVDTSTVTCACPDTSTQRPPECPPAPEPTTS